MQSSGKSKSIFLCASMNFYQELVRIEGVLTQMGWTVYIPQSAKVMKDKQDYDVSHVKGVLSYEERSRLIRRNFDEIRDSDAILVINNEKNGVPAYIGPNVLMEIGLAFHFGKKIFIWNDVPESAPYKEELNCFGVEYVNRDLEKIYV